MARLLGRSFMPHQQQIADVAGEVDERGIPYYREIRIALPRQSGKTLFALSETLDRLLGWSVEPQRSVYTAQSRLAARAKLEEYYEIVRKGPLDPLIAFRRQTGMESFRCANGSTLELSATEQASGHGPTLDQAVLDECWAQLDSRLEAAARPAMSTRPEAQMFLLSTAGTEESLWWRSKIDDGRARAEAGQRSGVAFFEWAAADDDDPDDEATWWSCMPALGRTVSVETIRADRDGMEPAEWERAYLNRWKSSGGWPRSTPTSGLRCATRPRSGGRCWPRLWTSHRIGTLRSRRLEAGGRADPCRGGRPRSGDGLGGGPGGRAATQVVSGRVHVRPGGTGRIAPIGFASRRRGRGGDRHSLVRPGVRRLL